MSSPYENIENDDMVKIPEDDNLDEQFDPNADPEHPSMPMPEKEPAAQESPRSAEEMFPQVFPETSPYAVDVPQGESRAEPPEPIKINPEKFIGTPGGPKAVPTVSDGSQPEDRDLEMPLSREDQIKANIHAKGAKERKERHQRMGREPFEMPNLGEGGEFGDKSPGFDLARSASDMAGSFTSHQQQLIRVLSTMQQVLIESIARLEAIEAYFDRLR